MITLFGEELLPEELTAASKPAPAAASGDSSKQYYTIGEVATLLNVRTSLLRYWTTEFGLKVRTTRKGDRLYTPALIEELRTIYILLRERGYTISGAKAKLAGGPAPAVDMLHLKQTLLTLRNQLLLIRNQLL